MNYFEFIVSLNDEKQYTYGCEIAQDIETLDELKQMAIDEFDEEDEEVASLIDVSDVSVEVNANGELYSYLAERFTENTADDIINILNQLTTDDYDEYQVVAYLECFDLENFDLQNVYDKTFGGQYFSSDAEVAEYYLDNFRDDIPDDIKNVIDYKAAYNYFGLNYELFESRGYYFGG